MRNMLTVQSSRWTLRLLDDAMSLVMHKEQGTEIKGVKVTCHDA